MIAEEMFACCFGQSPTGKKRGMMLAFDPVGALVRAAYSPGNDKSPAPGSGGSVNIAARQKIRAQQQYGSSQ